MHFPICWLWQCQFMNSTIRWCKPHVWVEWQQSRSGRQKWISSVTDTPMYVIHWDLADHTRTHTCQPAGIAGFDFIQPFKSSVLVVRLFYLWSHSDIVLLIANYWIWYIIVFFDDLAAFIFKKKERYALCPILIMRVNGESTTFGLASSLIWMAIGWWHSYMWYRPPL